MNSGRTPHPRKGFLGVPFPPSTRTEAEHANLDNAERQ